MLFNVFGNNNDPLVLCMHGMMQDWHSEYELLKPFENYYRLLIPAIDGFYEESKDFTDFADQCRQIEEYVQTNFSGEIYGAYGASQGGLMLTELLTRNRVKINTVKRNFLEYIQSSCRYCRNYIKSVSLVRQQRALCY